MVFENLISGLIGAVALNLLHEGLKHKKGTPRIDLLGEEALTKILNVFDVSIDGKSKRYQATLAGDIISNSLYYSLIGNGSSTFIWHRAILSGLTAGIGAVTLPVPMGLDEKPVAKTNQVKMLTIAYYLAGALVTATALKLIKPTVKL
ncbi:hypothetical protein ACFOWA_07765 [Pedobacter lithocola]|uniref:Uncharacterized protein n=1 Tax=Pedobacter lithocola TaxID=1908239 RepID=A0ABV8PAB0_9SPHI